MNERENIMEVLNHTGKAKWLPISDDSLLFLTSSANRDRPENNLDGVDWFGCHWTYDASVSGYAPAPESMFPYVVDDITEWESQVHFPDLDAIDWEAAAKKDLENFDRNEKILFMKTESGPFERLHQLYGFENAFIAMYEEPEAFKDFMSAITDFRIRLFDKLITYYKPDMIMMMDDLGSSTGPLFSLDLYRELIKPYDMRIASYIKSRDVKLVYHSCGCMQDFMDDLVELGADFIHPFQGGINDQDRIEEKYGDKVSFVGALDNLVHYDFSSEEVLRTEMRRVMDLFWDKKNLIVFPKSYAPGSSDILLDEAREYNREHLLGA